MRIVEYASVQSLDPALVEMLPTEVASFTVNLAMQQLVDALSGRPDLRLDITTLSITFHATPTGVKAVLTAEAGEK